MTKTKVASVIGLWLDRGHETMWIVSRDQMNESGQAEYTRTVATYSEDDYADAKIHAIDLAQQGCYCVIQTEADQSQTCIYQPEGAVNPLGA